MLQTGYGYLYFFKSAQGIGTFEELAEAVTSYVSRAAEKLRGQGSIAGSLLVFVRTNPFRTKDPQYQNSVTVPLPQATDDTLVLVRWALRALRRMYRPGYAYAKAGAMLSELRPKGSVQASLFPSAGDPWKSERLMAAMDAANRKWGRGTLKLASAGTENHWAMRRDRMSPGYTTDWEGLPSVRAG